MRNVFLASAFLLGLSACGGGGSSAFTKACVAEGESEKACKCADKTLKAELDDKTYKAISLAAAGKEAEAEKLMADMDMTGMTKMMGAMQKMATECGIDSMGM